MLDRCTTHIPTPCQPSVGLYKWNNTWLGWWWGSLWGRVGCWNGIHSCCSTPHPRRYSFLSSLFNHFRCLPCIYSGVFCVRDHFLHSFRINRKVLCTFWAKIIQSNVITFILHKKKIFFNFFAKEQERTHQILLSIVWSNYK